MPIQIPKISVNPQDQQEHAPRVQMQPLDTLTPMKENQGALEGVAKDAIRLHQEIQHQQADTTATNNSNEYLLWRKKRLYGDPETGWNGYANMTDADPQELYKKFDKEQEEKLNQLSAPGEGQNWSNETQTLVNRRLSRHFEESQLETLTQYSHQKRKYDDNVADTNVGLAQQGMYGASSVIVPGDSSSFGPMQAKIAAIRNTLIGRAMGTHGAVADENGDTVYNDGSGPKAVTLTNSIKYQIAKATADGLGNATKNLIDSKALDKAKALHEWADANGFLDVTTKRNVEDKLAKAQFKQEAYQHADEAMKHGGTAYLDKIQDPEMRVEAKKIVNEEQRYNEQDTKRKEAKNYNVAAKKVDEVMNSSAPFKGVMDMQKDDVISKVWDNMNAKQQQALEHRVQAPKETTPVVRQKWLDVITGQAKDASGNPVSLNGMSRPDLMTYTAGMKPADQKDAEKTWTKMNSQTGAQLDTEYKNFGHEFDQQAIGAKLLQKMPNSNFFTPSDQIKASLYKKELLDSIDPNHPMNAKERSDYVAKFVSDKIAGNVFKAPDKPQFNGGTKPAAPSTDQPPVTSKTDVSKVYGNLNGYQRMSFIQDYRKANSGAVPNEDQLIDFISKQTSKH